MHPVSSFTADEGLPPSDLLVHQQTFILDQIDDIIVTSDLSFRVRTLNKVATRYFGLMEEEAIGRRMSELVQFDYGEESLEAIREKLATSGSWQGELSFAARSGARYIFFFTVRFLPGLSGRPEGIMVVGRDVTMERAWQQELQHKERFYHGLINDSLDGILLIDTTARVTFASPSIRHVLGYNAEEVLGRNAFEYLHPDDHAITYDAFEREIAQNPIVKFVEVRVRHREGHWTWCMVRAHNLLSHPDVRGIAVYFHDDTLRRDATVALRESEARFRMLISNIQQGVLLHNADACVVLANETAVQLLGIPQEQLVGFRCEEAGWDVIGESGAALSRSELPVPTVLRTGLPVRNLAMGYRHPGTGVRHWLLANSAPVFNASGEIANIITSFTDISERKSLEARLIAGQVAHQRQLTQATIDSSEQERAAIGKELHDNIGQQLTTIKLYLDLARSTADEETAEMVALATRNVSDVINEIRGLCRSLIPSTLGDLGLTESINDLIHAFTRTRHIAIRFRADGFDEERVPENQKLMLFRILQEQLNNIVKHAGAENVTVTLDNSDGSVRMTVTDDGAGFDPATVRRGLGLTNMRNRAETCGGSFELISAPGEGCTLVVEVPEEKSL